jgi:hypothetical protein
VNEVLRGTRAGQEGVAFLPGPPMLTVPLAEPNRRVLRLASCVLPAHSRGQVGLCVCLRSVPVGVAGLRAGAALTTGHESEMACGRHARLFFA